MAKNPLWSGPGEGTPPDTRFIEDGVCELLKTRRVLKCSYPYGFFLQQGSTQKEIFELMQVIRHSLGRASEKQQEQRHKSSTPPPQTAGAQQSGPDQWDLFF